MPDNTVGLALGIFIIACAVWAILQLGGGFN